MNGKRTDADYEIEAISKGLAVIEVLIDEEPIKERGIAKKTQFSRDLVMRTMRTLRLRGYAVQNETTREWRVGPRLIRLAGDVSQRRI